VFRLLVIAFHFELLISFDVQCTDGMTGLDCDISNVCHETNIVLGDSHGDGWNGASAHIDAYTGLNQWRHVPNDEATWIEGQGTALPDTSVTQKALFNLGCVKDGCYAVHCKKQHFQFTRCISPLCFVRSPQHRLLPEGDPHFRLGRHDR
jgi:hypothetical protein